MLLDTRWVDRRPRRCHSASGAEAEQGQVVLSLLSKAVCSRPGRLPVLGEAREAHDAVPVPPLQAPTAQRPVPSALPQLSPVPMPAWLA